MLSFLSHSFIYLYLSEFPVWSPPMTEGNYINPPSTAPILDEAKYNWEVA